ncbi:hypothetical protein D3C76_1677640 [compost metagenome]
MVVPLEGVGIQKPVIPQQVKTRWFNIFYPLNDAAMKDEGIRFKYWHAFTGEQHEYAFKGHRPFNTERTSVISNLHITYVYNGACLYKVVEMIHSALTPLTRSFIYQSNF